jgi:YidC/Oxa1 family membrane protein insertase
MELYRHNGTSPFSSCLPLIAQMPIFFSLFQVLESAQKNPTKGGVGLLSPQLSSSFGASKLFGAPLHATIAANEGVALVTVIGIAMVAIMTITQFITQLQIMSKNVSAETMASPMYRQQKMLLYILPLVFIFSGIAFPLGVMFYWVFSNLWTMGQQFIVIRNSPTPGSEAAKAREIRLAKKAERQRERTGTPLEAPEVGVVQPKANNQRNQPVGKARSKRTGERRA